MRSASSALISALASGTPLYSADMFTLSLPDATVYRWTSADQDIIAGSNRWSSLGPTIDRSSWQSKNTTEIPEMTIQIYTGGDDFGVGNNLKKQAFDGLFDGAYMLLQRAFMPTYGDTSLGLVTLFGGLVGSLEITALGIKMTCTASNVQLEQNLPRRTYQSNCMHTLYDAQCTLVAATFTDNYVVSAASQIAMTWVGSAAVDPSLYVFGTMTVTSGDGIGQEITVAAANSGGVGFTYPLHTIPAPGDTFSVQQGCAKTVARCQLFGNQINYGGFPYIPSQSSGL